MQPLARDRYSTVLELLRAVPINTLFARTVVEHRCRGQVYVDRTEQPSVVHVIHPYGMSLLFGDAEPAVADQCVCEVIHRPRAATEWLQAFPHAWADRIAALPNIHGHTRVNFTFHPERFRATRADLPPSPYPVVRVDRTLFASMQGSVIPAVFWDDAEQFLHDGVGFAVMVDDEPASLAFSSFVIGSELELGIETTASHRGRGLALWACVALVDECLACGLTPVWACRGGNLASHRLAEKLGFAPVRHLPYFELPPRP